MPRHTFIFSPTETDKALIAGLREAGTKRNVGILNKLWAGNLSVRIQG